MDTQLLCVLTVNPKRHKHGEKQRKKSVRGGPYFEIQI